MSADTKLNEAYEKADTEAIRAEVKAKTDAKREIAEILSQLRVATADFEKRRNGLARELNGWLREDGYEPRKDEAPGALCVAGELIPAKVDYYSVRRRAALTGLELSSVNVCEKHAHVYPLTTLGA